MEDSGVGDELNDAFKSCTFVEDGDSFAPRQELFSDSVFDQLYADVLQSVDANKTKTASTSSSDLNAIMEESTSTSSSMEEPGIWDELVPIDALAHRDSVQQRVTPPLTTDHLLDLGEVSASDGDSSDMDQSSFSCSDEEQNLIEACRCCCSAAAGDEVDDAPQWCTCSQVVPLLPDQRDTNADVYDWLANADEDSEGGMFSRRSKSKKAKTPTGSSLDYAHWKRNEDKTTSCCSPLRSSQSKKTPPSAPNAPTGGLPVLTPSPYGSLRDVARPLDYSDHPGYAASEPAYRRRSDDTGSVCSSASGYQHSDIGDYLSLSPPHTQRLAHYNRYKARTSPTRLSKKNRDKASVYSPIRNNNNGSQILATTPEIDSTLPENDHTPYSSHVEQTPLFAASPLETQSESASVFEESLGLSEVDSTRSLSVVNVHVETTPLTTSEPERPVSSDLATEGRYLRDSSEVISTCTDSYIVPTEVSQDSAVAAHVVSEETVTLCPQTVSPVESSTAEETITTTYCSKMSRDDNSQTAVSPVENSTAEEMITPTYCAKMSRDDNSQTVVSPVESSTAEETITPTYCAKMSREDHSQTDVSPVECSIMDETITPTYCSKMSRDDNFQTSTEQNVIDKKLDTETLKTLLACADIPEDVVETSPAEPVTEEIVVPACRSKESSARPVDLALTSNVVNLEQYASGLAENAIQAAINQPKVDFEQTGKMARNGLSLKATDDGDGDSTTQPLIRTTPSSAADLLELEKLTASREYRLPTEKETEDKSHLSPHTPVADHVNVSYPSNEPDNIPHSVSKSNEKDDVGMDNSKDMKESSLLFRVTQAIQSNWPAIVFVGVAVTVGAIAVKLRMPAWME